MPENGTSRIRKVNKCEITDKLAKSLQPRYPERGSPLSRVRRILTHRTLRSQNLERPGITEVRRGKKLKREYWWRYTYRAKCQGASQPRLHTHKIV